MDNQERKVMVLLVGSNPPRQENVDRAFVETRSGRVLDSWKESWGSYRYVAVNASDLVQRSGDVPAKHVRLGFCDYLVECGADRFVALGKVAARALKKAGVSFFEMPHPSGRNRKLNDKDWTADVVRKCGEYLRG